MNESNKQPIPLCCDEFEALLRDGKVATLIAACERNLITARRNSSEELYANIYLARAYIRKNSTEQVTAIIGKLQGIAPNHPEVMAVAGLALLKSNNYGEAEALFKQALSQSPQSCAALSGLGWCYLNTDRQKAWQYLSSALQIDPTHSEALWGVCTISPPPGELPHLEKLLRTALEAEPLCSDVRISLAVCLFSMGRLDEARCEVSKVTMIDPHSQLAVELRDKLTEIATTNAAGDMS